MEPEDTAGDLADGIHVGSEEPKGTLEEEFADGIRVAIADLFDSAIQSARAALAGLAEPLPSGSDSPPREPWNADSIVADSAAMSAAPALSESGSEQDDTEPATSIWSLTAAGTSGEAAPDPVLVRAAARGHEPTVPPRRAHALHKRGHRPVLVGAIGLVVAAAGGGAIILARHQRGTNQGTHAVHQVLVVPTTSPGTTVPPPAAGQLAIDTVPSAATTTPPAEPPAVALVAAPDGIALAARANAPAAAEISPSTGGRPSRRPMPPPPAAVPPPGTTNPPPRTTTPPPTNPPPPPTTTATNPPPPTWPTRPPRPPRPPRSFPPPTTAPLGRRG